MAPSSDPAGSIVVVSPVSQPRFSVGTNSWMTVMSTEYMPVTPKPTNSRQITRKIQACSGVSAIAPVAIDVFSTVPIIALRRPILSAAHPQSSEPNGALMPEASRINPDSPKVRCQSLTMNASTKAISPKSKKSSMSPIVAAKAIFHWFAVSRPCRSRSSSIASSHSKPAAFAPARYDSSRYELPKLRPAGTRILRICMARCPGQVRVVDPAASEPTRSVGGGVLHRECRRGYRSSQGAVDLVDRAAPRLHRDQPKGDRSQHIPGGEVEKARY